jgi:hypothetical protein
VISLAKPMNEERHRRDMIAMREQRLDHQGVSLGRIEHFGVRLPEGDIARCRTAAVPDIERLGHAFRGPIDTERVVRLDARHLVDGKFVPPLGRVVELFSNSLAELGVVGSGRCAPDLRVEGPQPIDERHEIVGPMVADAVLRRGEQAVVGVEAEDVPRIDNGATLNPPLEQVDNLRQVAGRFVKPRGIASEVARGHQAIDLAQDASRSARHDARLALGGGRVSHASKNLRQVNVFELRGSLAGKLRVEMLPRAAKGLPLFGRFDPQPLGMFARDPLKQLLIEVVPVTGDVRQELRQRDGRIECRRPFAADAAGHQDGAGQDRGRFE